MDLPGAGESDRRRDHSNISPARGSRRDDEDGGGAIETFVVRVWRADPHGLAATGGVLHGAITHVGSGADAGFHDAAELLALLQTRMAPTTAEGG